LAGSRVPLCHCPGDPEVTPLLQVRWKRLVIDEGHIAGNGAATINYFVQELSIQHKWIVTGTPTSNILGLQLGRTTDEQDLDLDLDLDLVYPDSQDEGSHIRIWGNYDRLNLHKLAVMIGTFLAVPQFRSVPWGAVVAHTGRKDCFMLHVSKPLCDRGGPQPGAISVLNQVMQMVMVRHR
jgi:hypothetical protein